MNIRHLLLTSVLAFAGGGLVGCDGLELEEPTEAPDDAPAADAVEDVPSEPAPRRRVDSRPPPMAQPVPLYEAGVTDRQIDAATADVDGYFVLDLGDSWTPYLFTEATGEAEERVPHAYRETYLALARGELPDDHHGARASRDKYLELYGIMPTLGLLRERFRRVRDLECRSELDLSALESYDGFVAYHTNRAARRRANHFDYLERLRESPMELERRAVVRVLTERAMHALGVLEDGSAPPQRDQEVRTFRGRDGRTHEIPNLEEQVRERIVAALGLDSPESALDFLEGLGELSPNAERLVAVEAPPLPEYYDGDMDIQIEIDRGDVWYEFPYDAEGNERSQPTQRRPRISVIVEYNEQRIPIARFGTTIGGWRSEQIEGRNWWRYKNSPVGPRVWHQIVSAPVWMPPESTPPRSLLVRSSNGYRVNYHETGPSYASAYGLVAAYHRLYSTNEDGSIDIRGDEGIRTHGSVDYMSIMRRHSHGCHRLHNHIAVRLMSWVLAHRPHRRVGHQSAAFHRDLEHDGEVYPLDIERGGYVFDLERPIPVRVLEGRIRGDRSTPIEGPLPKYDGEVGAYMLPDGGAVTISRHGAMSPTALPDAGVDGGPMDAGLLNPFE